MFRKTVLAITVFAGVSFGAILDQAAKISFRTTQGSEVTLNGDSTWTYANASQPEISQEVIEELKDGRIIVIHTDKTWGFLENNARTKVLMKGIKNVEASAQSTNKDVSVATKEVTKEVYEKLGQKVNSALYGGVKKNSTVVQCIKELGSIVETGSSFADATKSWNVKGAAQLNQMQICNIADCVASIEAQEKATADSVRAAKKAVKK